SLIDSDQTMNRIVTAVAGVVTENHYKGGDPDRFVAVGDDLERAEELAQTLCPDAEDPMRIVDAAVRMVQGLLTQPQVWAGMRAFADELLRRRDMTEEEVLHVVRQSGLTLARDVPPEAPDGGSDTLRQ